MVSPGLSKTRRVHARSVFALVLTAALLATFAVSTTGASAAAAKPQSGGTLAYTTSADAADLLPWTPAFVGYVQGVPERFAIYDALAIANPSGKLTYRLAQSITTT